MQGKFTNIDSISPAYINFSNPMHVDIDNKLFRTIVVVDYNREQKDLILKELIDINMDIEISIYYEKQDSFRIIRDLTYYIGSTGVDVKENNESQENYEIIAFTHNDAKYIRKELQLNNEEIYFLYMYVLIKADNIKELNEKTKKIEYLLQTKGLKTKIAFFRQEDGLITNLPLLQNRKNVSNMAKRNVLTSGLAATYPFITSSLVDKDGIFFGCNVYNNSLIFINRFNSEKYKNSNMCVLGTSGAGKSFFIKLQIFRNRLIGITQYIIDPEREYKNLVSHLDGTYIKIGPGSKTYINVFDIREDSLEDTNQGYLANKITKLIGFFNLIFGKMTEEENAIIEEKLIELYNKKNITFNDKSLYKRGCFKSKYDMPILEDFYNLLSEYDDCKKYKIKLLPFVKGSLNFFNNYTNVEFQNKLVVADIYDLGEENMKYGMYLFTDLFWDKIKFNRNEKKIIYVDEIWRLIGVTSNSNVASFIYKIYKTIRKYGGSAVAITQDVMDLFSLEEGTYGKCIINNSSIKIIFGMEEENIKTISKFCDLSEKEKITIKSLKRGECFIFVRDNHVLAKIEASKIEEKII